MSFFSKIFKFLPKRKSNEQILKEFKELYKIDREMNFYEIRQFKKIQKHLSKNLKLAKVYPEPANININNNSYTQMTDESQKSLAEMFNKAGFNDEKIYLLKQEEKKKLLTNKKVFRIKWDQNK